MEITTLIKNPVLELSVVNINSDMSEKNSVNMPNILRSTIIAKTIDPDEIRVIKVADRSISYPQHCLTLRRYSYPLLELDR